MPQFDPLQLVGLLCDPFYELRNGKVDSNKSPIYELGQLVHAHVVYPPQKPQVLKLTHHDPRAPHKTTFQIADYVAGADPEKPLLEMGLPSDEHFYVLRGKVRPCIVLQLTQSDFYNRTTPEQYAWVAPCYTFKIKHTPAYVASLVAMKSPHLVYLPASPLCLNEQGVVRFELAQPVRISSLRPMFSPGPKARFLSASAWTVLQHRLYFYAHNKVLDQELEDTLNAYSEIVLDTYKKAAP